jgi:hypothetical protein
MCYRYSKNVVAAKQAGIKKERGSWSWDKHNLLYDVQLVVRYLFGSAVN